MRSKKVVKCPEIQLSFSKQNNIQQIQNKRLNVEMLRVHSSQKQRIMQKIWEMSQQQLCDYFTTYRLFPQELFTLNTLLDSNNLKLIKHDGKIYFGQVDKKKKSGIGICVYKEGKLYEGEFIDNDRTGCGIQIYSNGNLYIGQFLNNKKHGKGQFFWFSLNNKSKEPVKNTQYYQGDWWGGLPDGQGIHQKNNGDLYKGTFKNGLKHGLGTQHYGNGDYYKGEYVNGLPQGFGQYQWSDGSYYKGDFKQGLRSGYGMWSASNQQYSQNYQGHYSTDKKSGYGVYQWENGWIYRGNFQNDYRNGYGELFDGDSCMYKGYWQNGEQTDSDPQYNPSKTARTATSIQMSKVSLPKGQRNLYETIDLKQIRKQTETKLFNRPEYTIKKRPQSITNISKYQILSNAEKSKKQQNPEGQAFKSSKSLQKSLFRMNNIYVPGLHSSRLRK